VIDARVVGRRLRQQAGSRTQAFDSQSRVLDGLRDRKGAAHGRQSAFKFAASNERLCVTEVKKAITS
jgi:hypothetical protein